MGTDYPKKIWTQFESKQFKDRYKDGAVVPIVVDGYAPWPTDEMAKIGHLSFDSGKEHKAQIREFADTLGNKCAELRNAR